MLVHKNLIYYLKIFCRWTPEAFKVLGAMNTRNHSILQGFQLFSHKCKSHFVQCCPKHQKNIRFPCKRITNLFKGNLQNMKRHQVAKFQSSVQFLSLKRIACKQRRDILASDKNLQLIKVITLPVTNQSSWHGAVYPRSCFCVQQEFGYPVNRKAGAFKKSFAKSDVPNWFISEGDQQKKIFQSPLLSRQKFVLSTCQALNFKNFDCGWFKK